MAKPSNSKMTSVKIQIPQRPKENKGNGELSTLRRPSLEKMESPANVKVTNNTARKATLFSAACSTRLPVGPTSGRIMQRKKKDSPEATASAVPVAGLKITSFSLFCSIKSSKGWKIIGLKYKSFLQGLEEKTTDLPRLNPVALLRPVNSLT